jgi:hypothetical protein
MNGKRSAMPCFKEQSNSNLRLSKTVPNTIDSQRIKSSQRMKHFIQLFIESQNNFGQNNSIFSTIRWEQFFVDTLSCPKGSSSKAL